MSTTVDIPNNNEKLVPADGSALYYALLYLENQPSTRVLETLQFIQTLSNTLNDVSESNVAEKKIHWWHEELTRLSMQQARHPVSIAIQTYVHNQLSIEACLKILSAAATERYTSFATEQELNSTVLADYSARTELLDAAMNTSPMTETQTNEHQGEHPIKFQKKSEILVNNTINNDKALESNTIELMALGLGQFDRLNSLAKRLRYGYPVFSDERYNKYELTSENLSNFATQSAKIQHQIRALLDSAVSEALASVENAIDCPADPHLSKPTNPVVQILCQIRYAQLKLWKKRKPNLLNESITLTPLRKFIIAYRCRRRFEHS